MDPWGSGLLLLRRGDVFVAWLSLRQEHHRKYRRERKGHSYYCGQLFHDFIPLSVRQHLRISFLGSTPELQLTPCDSMSRERCCAGALEEGKQNFLVRKAADNTDFRKTSQNCYLEQSEQTSRTRYHLRR